MIKFGTDGWRGIIADDFTFENVRRVAGGIAAYVLRHEDAARGVIIGYDTRFLSQHAARIAAEVIAGAGIPVQITSDSTPTPAISLAVKSQGAAGGVVVTSSHNPWNWNGVKFKARFGGSATPAIMKVIEEEVGAGAMPKGQAASIKEVDLKPAYMEAISRFADLDLIAKAKFRFAVDSMYGSGRGVLTRIFQDRGIDYVAIRQELNPLFPGINPEPIEPHVEMLRQTVLKESCHAGLAVDGDADRIGAIAEDGSFVDSHKCFCRPLALGPGAEEVARGRGARLQHHRHGGPHRRQVRTQADRVSHRLQVHCRPDDGTRNCGGRRRIRRDRIFALSAGA